MCPQSLWWVGLQVASAVDAALVVDKALMSATAVDAAVVVHEALASAAALDAAMVVAVALGLRRSCTQPLWYAGL